VGERSKPKRRIIKWKNRRKKPCCACAKDAKGLEEGKSKRGNGRSCEGITPAEKNHLWWKDKVSYGRALSARSIRGRTVRRQMQKDSEREADRDYRKIGGRRKEEGTFTLCRDRSRNEGTDREATSLNLEPTVSGAIGV